MVREFQPCVVRLCAVHSALSLPLPCAGVHPPFIPPPLSKINKEKKREKREVEGRIRAMGWPLEKDWVSCCWLCKGRSGAMSQSHLGSLCKLEKARQGTLPRTSRRHAPCCNLTLATGDLCGASHRKHLKIVNLGCSERLQSW